MAILFGHVQAMEILLRAGADPNLCPQEKAFCPLVSAIICSTPGFDEGKRERAVTLLLEAGAKPNAPASGKQPLVEAISHGHSRIAQMLVRAGAKPVQNTPPWESPLLIAAKDGDAKAIAVLLAAGQRPDEPTDGGFTALWLATAHDHADCVKILLKAGARFALEKRPSSSFTTTWFEVIGSASADVLEAYSLRGLNPKAVNGEDETFLHLAARRGRADSVKWLVRHGAKVDARDHSGATPLMRAASEGKLEAVRALLDAKASILPHDGWGRTAKVLAAEKNHPDVVRLLDLSGAKEYAGSRLPPSDFDAELAHKAQQDVTGGFYRHLTFLDSGLRFFATHDPRPPKRFAHDLTVVRASLFAVRPGDRVVKLARIGNFTRLGLRLRSKSDALALVQLFAQPWLAVQDASLDANFEGMDLVELPENSHCFSLSPEPLRKAGVKKASAQSSGRDGDTTFVVTRYMLPRGTLATIHGSLVIESLTRTTERVGRDGSYALTTEVVPTPGLVLERTCYPR